MKKYSYMVSLRGWDRDVDTLTEYLNRLGEWEPLSIFPDPLFKGILVLFMRRPDPPPHMRKLKHNTNAKGEKR